MLEEEKQRLVRTLIHERRKRRLTQSEMAHILKVTQGRVNQVERGRGTVKIDTLMKFLRRLGYQFDFQVYKTEEVSGERDKS